MKPGTIKHREFLEKKDWRLYSMDDYLYKLYYIWTDLQFSVFSTSEEYDKAKKVAKDLEILLESYDSHLPTIERKR